MREEQQRGGRLYLPQIQGDLDELEIAKLLIGLSVTPVDARQLSPDDRSILLTYLKQLCAVVELPSSKDVYLTTNAQVWQVLSVNWPESKVWLTDPTMAKDGKVSLKSIAPHLKRISR